MQPLVGELRSLGLRLVGQHHGGHLIGSDYSFKLSQIRQAFGLTCRSRTTYSRSTGVCFP